MQQSHPIAFISKALSPKHQVLSAYDKKMFTLFFAIKKWHHYLIRRHFTIRTDHKPLKYLMEQKITTPSQHVWLAQLMAYDFNIVYKKMADNRATDALSKMLSHEIWSLALSSVPSYLNQQILKTYERDAGIGKIIKELQDNPTSYSSYTLEQGQLRRKGKLVIGQDLDLQSQILLLFHSLGIGGHFGVHTIYQHVSSILYWKGL